MPAWLPLAVSAALGVCACSPAPSGKSAQPKPGPTAPAPSAATQPVPPEPEPQGEALALHMRDHLSLVTQARDALIRGRLVDATGALTWLAQHREPKAPAGAQLFLQQLHQHAQRAIDTSDLRTAGEAIGALAATCGECHRVQGAGPKLEPSGFEDLDDTLTVATHMRGYLWATDTLWNALVADDRLWGTGVATLATLKPPARPRELAPGFDAIRAWAKSAGAAKSAAERGRAYGELIAACGTCHVAHGADPAQAR